MMRSLIPLALLAFSLPALAQEPPPPRIQVTGEGEVAAAPDMAQVQIGVTTESGTAAAALDANSEATAAVLARLAEQGVAEADMQTGNLSLYPRRDDRRSQNGGGLDEPPIVGFVANHTVSVTIRQLDSLGGVLDAVVSDGANTLGGLSFGLQDPAEALDAARREAVADAMRKAELYAEAAGVVLGPVRAISEPVMQDGPMPMMAMEADMMRGAVPVAEGEVKVTATVTMSFAIGE
ncbi:SIMPL domain-containing protein [Halovulum marinum]|nr:SIMPL domain-containing protein [Halovulum marinum]